MGLGRKKKRSREVNAENLVEIFDALFRGGEVGAADPGIVDEHVQTPKPIGDLLAGFAYVGLLGHVTSDADVRSAKVRRAFGGLSGLDIDQGDAITTSGEKSRRRQTNAIGGARDRRYGAFVVHGRPSSYSSSLDVQD